VSVAQQRVLVAQFAPAGSVRARCQALGLSRSDFYYQSYEESAYSPELTHLTGEEFTQYNLKGMLGLRDYLRDHLPQAGHAVNGKHARRFVRLMGHGPNRAYVPD